MPSLSVKNVPEELLERLRARAKQHHRSLQGEMLAILEEAAKPKGYSAQEAYRRIRELGIRSADTSTEIIREERDARSGC